MDRKLHIFYRHVHIKAERNSRDPKKNRPSWFSYEACFRNLLSTIRNDPNGNRVKLTVMFDGLFEDFMDDFVAGYQANKDLNIDLQFLEAGSDKNSALITLNFIYRSNIPDSDLVYMLENDYMHQSGWVSKLFELYDSEIVKDYVSLYDHRDKYFLPMYEGLQARLFHTDSHHWRTSPSSCGSYISQLFRFRSDYDILQLGLPDYFFFNELIDNRQRVLLTPIPGLSTHCMEGYLSPAVDWPALLV
ncbi:MAG: hypothetical protein IPN53_19615 [Comamonadaceae bacterium]|nr:hypothetical protein [Comamonadaceae bacterium]